jgi:NDP-sugar pyrophosphorylase family protein
MIEAHRNVRAMASILLVPFISQYGIVDLAEDGKVIGFRSEPVLPYWVNGGIYVFDQAIRALLPDRGDHEEKTFPQLAEQGKLLAYRSEKFWRAVDTVKDLSVVKDHLTKQLMKSFLGV